MTEPTPADDVEEVQRLWLAGDQPAARARVPVEIGLGTNLIGPDDRIRERLRRYRDVGITGLRVNLAGDDAGRQLDDLGRLLDLVRGVDAEVAT